MEVKQLWYEGAKSYVLDMWNLLDFTTNSLYVATISLRVVSYIQVWQNQCFFFLTSPEPP
jgi:hypothetical protein